MDEIKKKEEIRRDRDTMEVDENEGEARLI
jgi:hypothetical protein